VRKRDFRKLMAELHDLSERCDKFLEEERCLLWDPDWSCSAIPPTADELCESFPAVATAEQDD